MLTYILNENIINYYQDHNMCINKMKCFIVKYQVIYKIMTKIQYNNINIKCTKGIAFNSLAVFAKHLILNYYELNK